MSNDTDLDRFLKALADTDATGALPDPVRIRILATARARRKQWDAATRPVRIAEWTAIAACVIAAVIVVPRTLDVSVVEFFAIVLAGTLLLMRMLLAEE